jgi:hypothetical protein
MGQFASHNLNEFPSEFRMSPPRNLKSGGEADWGIAPLRLRLSETSGKSMILHYTPFSSFVLPPCCDTLSGHFSRAHPFERARQFATRHCQTFPPQRLRPSSVAFEPTGTF